MNQIVLIRGGGDLASGVAARLYRSGFRVLVTELPKPLVVRRKVSFAEAVFAGVVQVEEIKAKRAADCREAEDCWAAGVLPVLVDPELVCLKVIRPDVLVDARMTKRPPEMPLEIVPLMIGLGPGFTAGKDCHAVVETMRGHSLGRVIWQGKALPNTGIPEAVLQKQGERVLRAPVDGVLKNQIEIGTHLEKGDMIAEVGGKSITAPFKGVLRGLLHEGLNVEKGMKIGDLDPRDEASLCFLISDKALAIGGGVLEAILSDMKKRAQA